MLDARDTYSEGGIKMLKNEEVFVMRKPEGDMVFVSSKTLAKEVSEDHSTILLEIEELQEGEEKHEQSFVPISMANVGSSQFEGAVEYLVSPSGLMTFMAKYYLYDPRIYQLLQLIKDLQKAGEDITYPKTYLISARDAMAMAKATPTAKGRAFQDFLNSLNRQLTVE